MRPTRSSLSATGEPSNHPITSWTINWGDGTGNQTLSGNPDQHTHVYANAGSYTITASATEDEGTFSASPLNVTAKVVPPDRHDQRSRQHLTTAPVYTLGLSATGQPANHPITGWTINWGDGSAPQTVSGNPSSVTHVYQRRHRSLPDHCQRHRRRRHLQFQLASGLRCCTFRRPHDQRCLECQRGIALHAESFLLRSRAETRFRRGPSTGATERSQTVTGNPTHAVAHATRAGRTITRSAATATDQDGTWPSNSLSVDGQPRASHADAERSLQRQRRLALHAESVRERSRVANETITLVDDHLGGRIGPDRQRQSLVGDAHLSMGPVSETSARRRRTRWATYNSNSITVERAERAAGGHSGRAANADGRVDLAGHCRHVFRTDVPQSA